MNMLNRNKREKDMAQEIRYRKSLTCIGNCETALRSQIKANEEAAITNENAGRHACALKYAATVKTLKNMANKMANMRGEVELMHSMKAVFTSYDQIASVCNEMMAGMNGMFDSGAMAKAAYKMENNRCAMDAMLESMDTAFPEDAMSGVDDDPEAEKCLDSIIKAKRHSGSDRLAALTQKAFERV